MKKETRICSRMRTRVWLYPFATVIAVFLQVETCSADEEKVFLISEELEFRTGETDGEPNFVWRDLYGDVDEFFEFVATGTNAPTRAFFETCMYRAMYERKFKTSADNLQDKALEQFVWQ